jgi:hypothetical protein
MGDLIAVQICDGPDGCGTIIEDRWGARQHCTMWFTAHKVTNVMDSPLMRKTMVAKVTVLHAALLPFIDGNKCHYDHDAYCQEHGGDAPGRCQVARARQLLGLPDLSGLAATQPQP